jgi:hypothetical protein
VLRAYLEWPGLQQVFQVHRVRRLANGRVEEETSYGITSLGPDAIGAAGLLGHVRGHWGIENNLHGERDTTLGEDSWRVRSGSAPQALAATRNALLLLLEEQATPNKAAATRRFMIRPLEAVDLITDNVKH